jgi:hypothetical protein
MAWATPAPSGQVTKVVSGNKFLKGGRLVSDSKSVYWAFGCRCETAISNRSSNPSELTATDEVDRYSSPLPDL